MAELRGLSVKVPIRFSERAQRDLYETCMAYKELAETRGAENAKLRELVRAFDWCTENFDMPCKCDRCPLPQRDALNPECELIMGELGIREEQ